MKDKVMGIIRHVLTLVGGILVATGKLTEEMVEQGTTLILELGGVVIALIGFIGSLKNKDSQQKKVEEALKSPPPSI